MRHTAYTSCYMQHTEYTAPPFSRRARTDADRPLSSCSRDCAASLAAHLDPARCAVAAPRAAGWLQQPRSRCAARIGPGDARPAPPSAVPAAPSYTDHAPGTRRPPSPRRRIRTACHMYSTRLIGAACGMRRTARRSLGFARRRRRRRRRRRGLFGWCRRKWVRPTYDGCWWAGRGSLHAARTRLPQRPS